MARLYDDAVGAAELRPSQLGCGGHSGKLGLYVLDDAFDILIVGI